MAKVPLQCERLLTLVVFFLSKRTQQRIEEKAASRRGNLSVIIVSQVDISYKVPSMGRYETLFFSEWIIPF